MASTIEWTEKTWNPTTGCSPVSEGCEHCYAARIASGRLKNHPRYKGLTCNGQWTGEVRTHPELLNEPRKWRKPRIVFVNSMSDLFHPTVSAEFIAELFLVMCEAERHIFQVLTKRPERISEFPWITEHWPANVWLGVSVELPKYLWRIDKLVRIPAAVRFVSLEPLLGAIDSARYLLGHCWQCGRDCENGFVPPERCRCGWRATRAWYANYADTDRSPIDQVIVGAETGPRARPMNPQHVRDIRDQCIAAGVPFLFKSWGTAMPLDSVMIQPGDVVRLYGKDRRVEIDRHGTKFVRIEKKHTGRLLDGREWNQMPGDAPCPAK